MLFQQHGVLAGDDVLREGRRPLLLVFLFGAALGGVRRVVVLLDLGILRLVILGRPDEGVAGDLVEDVLEGLGGQAEVGFRPLPLGLGAGLGGLGLAAGQFLPFQGPMADKIADRGHHGHGQQQGQGRAGQGRHRPVAAAPAPQPSQRA